MDKKCDANSQIALVQPLAGDETVRRRKEQHFWSDLMRGSDTGLSFGRRDFFRTTARHIALAVIAAVAAFLGLNSWRAGRSCQRPNFCSSCPQFSGCDLPKADAARKAA